MKRLLLPLLAALALPVVAEGTWVEVARKRRTRWFVDAQSLVRNGDFAYLNTSMVLLDEKGIEEERAGDDPVGKQVNCKDKTIFNQVDDRWEAYGTRWSLKAIGEFACRR